MSDEIVHSDVLITGLGPAGACAAAEVARAGWTVVGVDRKAEAGTPVQCAELVPGPIGMEVADVSVAHEQLIRSMVTFVEDDAPDTVENFPGHMINRRAFDRHLCMLAEDDADGPEPLPALVIGALLSQIIATAEQINILMEDVLWNPTDKQRYCSSATH